MPNPPDQEISTLYVRGLPSGVKRRLIDSADARGISLNAYVLTVLAQHEDPLPKREPTPIPPSITCPRCLRTSFHPEDIAQRYCGACHQYHPEIT